MILRNTYEYLQHLKLVHSHRDFSTDFLSRRPRYYDDLICARRRPSPAVLACLAVRLGELAAPMRRDPHAGERLGELDALIARSFVELRKCFVTALPRKRPAMNIPLWLRKK